MTRNIRLVLAYDGTDFHGWQTQPGLRTVQSDVTQALRRVVRHQVDLQGSGRTDAGVHATGQVANFKTESTIPAHKLKNAIGSRLAKDVCLLRLQDVHPEFDSRRSALSKQYRYRIHNAAHRPVSHQCERETYHFWHGLDLERMRDGARRFVGTMDFVAFASKGCQRETTVRKVHRCEVERYGDEIHIQVEGSGFLYNQVRNMVGTLIEVGRGRWHPEAITEILESLDRCNAGPTAPARGLALRWVRYPVELLQPPEGPFCDLASSTETVHSAMQTQDACE